MQKENVQNTGAELFDKLLTAYSQSAEEVVALFNEDAVIEYPYAVSVGTPTKLNMQEFEHYLKGALEQMPGLKFSRVRVYQTTEADSYWAEAHGELVIPKTGKTSQQDYVMHFTVQNGKFSLYREYWNPMAALEAFRDAESVRETFNANKK